MKNLFVLIAIVFTGVVPLSGQQQSNNEDVKYVIFTSRSEAEQTGEGISRFTPEKKSDTNKYPSTMFHFISKSRGISAYANHVGFNLDKLAKTRKVTEKDKLVIKEEPDEFLNSVDLVDMDILFPKMTKDEFVEFWNRNLFGNVLGGKKVYFIDRSEIKNHKIKLYPVYVMGINQY
ncbi:MAG: hypothetical protein PHI28_09465 [Mangrovibacterium sp.]|nr:hypothetical protein [Mangrovibacterium sp.]